LLFVLVYNEGVSKRKEEKKRKEKGKHATIKR
jgi:hypothetical protein